MENLKLIKAIAKRANKLHLRNEISCKFDLLACYKYYNINLYNLLHANDFDFTHDILGIAQNLNHDTGMLDCFIPRFSE